MTDKELYSRAVQAARDYHTVYRVFPEKIGIHHERFPTFYKRHTGINIPELTATPSAYGFTELSDTDRYPPVTVHHINFDQVAGDGIQYDECYLPVPYNPNGAMSADDIATIMATQKRLREACR